MKHYFRKPDNSIAVISFADDSNLKKEIDRLISMDIISKDWKKIDIKETPDEFLFDAFEYNTKSKKIEINKTKAIDIFKNKLRISRHKKLEELDKKFMLCLESGQDFSEIVEKKKFLRDITNNITEDMSIDEMKSFVQNFESQE